jgi:lysophospholipase L1-like esterase
MLLGAAGAYAFNFNFQNAFLAVYGGVLALLLVFVSVTLLTWPVRLLRPVLKVGAIAFLLFLSLELPSALAFRIVHGKWHLDDVAQHLDLFEPHPWLVGVPKPGSTASKPDWKWSAHHNSLGFRGDEFSIAKSPGVKRIVTIGGSTVWGTSVNDHETWPYQLQHALGPGHEVINYGVPGYSSAEHLIQTSLNLMDLHPDSAIYYMGWNDMVNVHVKGTKTDYSNYHGLYQYQTLDLLNARLWLGPDFAFIRQFISIAQAHGYLSPIFNPPIHLDGDADTGTDLRVLSIYKRNVGELAALCRSQGIEPVFVPQVLNYSILTGDVPNAWTPIVRPKDMKKVMTELNDTMRAAASKADALYISDVLEHDWKESDFVDIGHFTAEGGRTFAAIIARVLALRGERPPMANDIAAAPSS